MSTRATPRSLRSSPQRTHVKRSRPSTASRRRRTRRQCPLRTRMPPRRLTWATIRMVTSRAPITRRSRQGTDGGPHDRPSSSRRAPPPRLGQPARRHPATPDPRAPLGAAPVEGRRPREVRPPLRPRRPVGRPHSRIPPRPRWRGRRRRCHRRGTADRAEGGRMTLTSVASEISRDRFGRPLVIPPGGGKPVAYTRATTFVDALEDKYNLQKWQQRMVILGLVDRPDLLLSAAAHREDKTRLNKVAEDAIEAAKAYAAATAELKVLHSETFTVLLDLKVGGTPDRVVEYEDERYIADIKTGSIEYGSGKIAMQLAVYAHSQLYDIPTGRRTPLPEVSTQRGIIIHLPAGTGTCALHWVNIDAGWAAVQLAAQVRTWRARKDLTTPLNVAAAIENLTDAGLITEGDKLLEWIAAAPTQNDLTALWKANEARWTDQHKAAASARYRQLAQTA